MAVREGNRKTRERRGLTSSGGGTSWLCATWSEASGCAIERDPPAEKKENPKKRKGDNVR